MAEWGIDLMRLCPDKSILNTFIFPAKINAFIIQYNAKNSERTPVSNPSAIRKNSNFPANISVQ